MGLSRPQGQSPGQPALRQRPCGFRGKAQPASHAPFRAPHCFLSGHCPAPLTRAAPAPLFSTGWLLRGTRHRPLRAAPIPVRSTAGRAGERTSHGSFRQALSPPAVLPTEAQGCSRYFSSFFVSSASGLLRGQEGVLQALHRIRKRMRISKAMTQLKEMATTAPVDSSEPMAAARGQSRERPLTPRGKAGLPCAHRLRGLCLPWEGPPAQRRRRLCPPQRHSQRRS